MANNINNSSSIIFSDINMRNDFIKKFDNSFNNSKIGRIVGLSREMVRIIRDNLKTNQKRKYIKAICPDCGKERLIRKDQYKNNLKNYCLSCAKKNSPKYQRLKSKIAKKCINCGKDIIISKKTWINGTKKCNSCRTSETNKIKKGLAAQKSIYAQYRNKAKIKHLDFDLSFDEFMKITKQNCFYCNIEPSNIKKSEYNNGDFIYNGIDRMDNSKGYIIDNIIPCCKICNYAKNTMPLEEFYKWVNTIYANLKEKGVLQ